jgi:LPXTG-site transpeptidase (sortase) family protein
MESTRQKASVPVPFSILVRVLQYVCLVAGLLGAGYVGLAIVEAHTYQARKIREIEQPRSSTTPAPLSIGAAIAEIEIPRVGLHAVVVQGDSDKILRLAVGHMPQTALPGQSGNMVFAGHRDSFFRALRSVRKGDQIVVDTSNGSYDYQVESTSIVAPADLSVLRSVNGRRELTLITCYPFSWIGSAPQRFIVRAGTVEQLESSEGAPPLESGQLDPATPARVSEESKPSGTSEQPETKSASTKSHQSPEIALRNDGHAELALAQQYLRDPGVREDRDTAADLLWAAVGRGSTEAEVELATLYLLGDGVPGKNCEQARILLRAAANSGNSVADQKLAALPGYGCE